MGAFELQDTPVLAERPAEMLLERPGCPVGPDDRRKVKDECIIAYKVYDSCRRQNCLTPRELGPARAAGICEINDATHKDGEIIKPVHGAASVTMERVVIKRIQVVDKQPSPFRTGFWDVDVKYVFEYRLIFRDASGCVIDKVNATNFFSMKVTLFGSVGADLVIGTDLYKGRGETFTAAPFVWVEAQAVGLDAKLHHHHGHHEVHVTIGLFSILKLFRLVHLNVQSKGFCIPEECHGQGDINPCEYFADLDFPMDIFAPPQRKEFKAGISENIPKGRGVTLVEG